MEQQNTIQKQLLTLDEVVAMTGFSSSTIYKYMDQGKFPKPKKYSTRNVRWRLTDVQNHINA
ncbi:MULTISPECIES: helix-turn-helix transcriptional regulator [Pasteurellaceae]|uniref:Prophage regulatory protein n=2 Tax=Pasteurellaceae TaxID=712 RepID=A0A1H7XMK3_9PAST|nr:MULTISPECIES: AlpA family phage regulatory protein [Pasteurella]MBR0574159.1 AlpA family phage regulatory protein [Pasteurella atlantica]MDP8039268.1 AlpA family phage regulatory protein [Pasteurella atlantica]MDP8041360.1 AlpA family phage regulatory protein [Pasteurella atlantica]MDP8043496.1 AlpA family phage regulatory protein [Pasteurella atlantica]MDP8045586.1 AlpA family phage regulatory protein [Pasteurella atlantica]